MDEMAISYDLVSSKMTSRFVAHEYLVHVCNPHCTRPGTLKYTASETGNLIVSVISSLKVEDLTNKRKCRCDLVLPIGFTSHTHS